MDRAKNGQINYFKGKAAEEQVARAYVRNGFEVVEHRWKTRDGEIDLIARYKSKIYFVEVKSSDTFDQALGQITQKQQARIQNAALQYLAQEAGSLDVECRFDAALVDGVGRLKVMPGALLQA